MTKCGSTYLEDAHTLYSVGRPTSMPLVRPMSTMVLAVVVTGPDSFGCGYRKWDSRVENALA